MATQDELKTTAKDLRNFLEAHPLPQSSRAAVATAASGGASLHARRGDGQGHARTSCTKRSSFSGAGTPA